MPFTTVDTVLTRGFPGMKANNIDHVVESAINEEASAELAFGRMVQAGTADKGAKALTAAANKLRGVVLHSDAYMIGTELGTLGIKSKVTFDVVTRGQVFVQVEEAVTPASTVYCRAILGAGVAVGAFRATADAANTINCGAFARFVGSSFSVGGVLCALLEFNLSGRGGTSSVS